MATRELTLEAFERTPGGDPPIRLEQPLESGESVPTIDGMALAEGDTVVWTFPKAKGCRCGAQAMQYDKLAREQGTPVYAVAAAPESELENMAERYDLADITLVSDPEGEIADEFGIELDQAGRIPRHTFFIRDGRVTDVSDGVPGLAQAEGDCPFERNERDVAAHADARDGTVDMGTPDMDAPSMDMPSMDTPSLSDAEDCALGRFDPPEGGDTIRLAQDDESALYDELKHPGVYIVTGARGSGKSALAFRAGEKLAEKNDAVPVTIGMPEHVKQHIPGKWLHANSLDSAPSDSVVVIDEAYMKYSARESMQKKNIKMGAYVNTSRHCNRTILFVSQNSAHLERMAVTEADGYLIKEPGTFHAEFERMQLRSFTEKAEESFEQLPDSMDNRGFVYAVTDNYEGLVENGLPDWYDETVSKSYAPACESVEQPDDDESEENEGEPDTA